MSLQVVYNRQEAFERVYNGENLRYSVLDEKGERHTIFRDCVICGCNRVPAVGAGEVKVDNFFRKFVCTNPDCYYQWVSSGMHRIDRSKVPEDESEHGLVVRINNMNLI
jgi:hypothetical protein